MIYINNEKIDFNYYYNFPEEGNYEIKYIFKKPLISTNSLFSGCKSLISIDLSNFNFSDFVQWEKSKYKN